MPPLYLGNRLVDNVYLGNTLINHLLLGTDTVHREVQPIGTPTLTLGRPRYTVVPLSWTAVRSADSYTVRYRVNGTTDYTEAAATGTTHSITGLTNGMTYDIGVRANVGPRSGSYSADMQVTTLNTIAPVVTITAAANRNIQIAWVFRPTGVTVTGSMIRRKRSDQTDDQYQFFSVTGTTAAFRITGLGRRRDWNIGVQSMFTDPDDSSRTLNSPWSATVTGTTT